MSRLWFYLFFFVSGFCSLVCEVVWLRLAMAAFGLTTANVSMVLSIFTGGLALGSWLAGGLVRQQWLPHADPGGVAAVTRSFRDSFPYVKIYRSFDGWGLHFLGSDKPSFCPALWNWPRACRRLPLPT